MILKPKNLNNLSITNLNYFKISHFVHTCLAGVTRHHKSALCLPAGLLAKRADFLTAIAAQVVL